MPNKIPSSRQRTFCIARIFFVGKCAIILNIFMMIIFTIYENKDIFIKNKKRYFYFNFYVKYIIFKVIVLRDYYELLYLPFCHIYIYIYITNKN